MSADETLGRFGHHPDPADDFCVEVDIIEGLLADVRAGLAERTDVLARVDRALAFRVGGRPDAIAAKANLRRIEDELRAVPEGTWRPALLIKSEATPEQRRRNFETYERLKRELPGFYFTDGNPIPPRDLERLIRCVVDCLPAACDADAALAEARADLTRERAARVAAEAVVAAAQDAIDGWEGATCVVDPPCGDCRGCRLASSVAAYRAATEEPTP